MCVEVVDTKAFGTFDLDIYVIFFFYFTYEE